MNSIFLVLIALVPFLSFIWASIFFFKVENAGAKLGKQMISFLGAVTMLVHLQGVYNSNYENLLYLVFSISLYVTATAVFWLSIRAVSKPLDFAFTDQAPNRFISSGPYKYVRHPFYLSYTIAWLAGCVFGGVWVYLTTVLMVSIYYIAARQEELKFSNTEYAENYRTYVKNTGMFFPKFRSLCTKN